MFRRAASAAEVAKMERRGLVEENVRTGEKTRNSGGSTREITFEGRSYSGRKDAQAIGKCGVLIRAVEVVDLFGIHE
jgi:hypothetical protein